MQVVEEGKSRSTNDVQYVEASELPKEVDQVHQVRAYAGIISKYSCYL